MKKLISLTLLVIIVIVGCHSGNTNTVIPPDPQPSHVRVVGNKIVSPEGTPVFLKIGSWENPFEGSVTGERIIWFMGYMDKVDLNCILLKGNMWLIHDDRSMNQKYVDAMHWLIREADRRGIYVILNLFDVWSRGRGGNKYNTDPRSHPINVWDWNQRGSAAEFIKWVTREFKKHPRLLFELGNEMEKNDEQAFHRIAKIHLLPHFYAIAGKDRPIDVSQHPLWKLPVNVLFNHNPISMPFVKKGDRAIITNELAYNTKMWADSYIRNPANSQKYFMAFELAKRMNHSGVAAATILNINKPINGTADAVLKRLGRL